MSIFDRLSQKSSQNDKYLDQAQNIWSMLDDMAQSDPQSYKNFIDKTLKEGKELIKAPEAHMCVRTSVKEDDFYINFFTWNKIPEPESDDKPITIFGKDIYTIQGVKCVNVAFSHNTLKSFGKNAIRNDEQEAFIKLTFDFIENQNKVKINREKWTIIDDLSFGSLKDCQANLMGDLVGDKTFQEESKTTETDHFDDESCLNKLLKLDVNALKEPKKLIIEELNVVKMTPEYTLNSISESQLVIKVVLDKIFSINECNLFIEKDMLELTANEKFYEKLKIDLSTFKIDMDSVEAKFIKKSSTLKIIFKFI